MSFNPYEAQQDRWLGRSIRYLVANTPQHALVVEIVACPHCRKHSLVIHPFSEVVRCQYCGIRLASRAPNWPVDGEPRAVDWEEAVLDFGAEEPEVAAAIHNSARAYAEQRESNYP